MKENFNSTPMIDIAKHLLQDKTIVRVPPGEIEEEPVEKQNKLSIYWRIESPFQYVEKCIREIQNQIQRDTLFSFLIFDMDQATAKRQSNTEDRVDKSVLNSNELKNYMVLKHDSYIEITKFTSQDIDIQGNEDRVHMEPKSLIEDSDPQLEFSIEIPRYKDQNFYADIISTSEELKAIQVGGFWDKNLEWVEVFEKKVDDKEGCKVYALATPYLFYHKTLDHPEGASISKIGKGEVEENDSNRKEARESISKQSKNQSSDIVESGCRSKSPSAMILFLLILIFYLNKKYLFHLGSKRI
ncbi:MAG: hypothetical protein KDD52_06455 [Bdellovibrionales bacterium]|nr:hypothetical protein [Bdellovibrionales bacterium]